VIDDEVFTRVDIAHEVRKTQPLRTHRALQHPATRLFGVVHRARDRAVTPNVVVNVLNEHDNSRSVVVQVVVRRAGVSDQLVNQVEEHHVLTRVRLTFEQGVEQVVARAHVHDAHRVLERLDTRHFEVVSRVFVHVAQDVVEHVVRQAVHDRGVDDGDVVFGHTSILS
jgi:hypothetical protein